MKTKYRTGEGEHFIKLLKETIQQLENYEEEVKGEFKQIMLDHFKETLQRSRKELIKEEKYGKQFNFFLDIVRETLNGYTNKYKKKIKKS